MKEIKNTDITPHIWGGVLIPAGTTYTCADQVEANYFIKDDNFITSLSSGQAEVYYNSVLLIGISHSLDMLRGTLTDSEGAMLVRSRAFSNSDGFRFRGVSFSGSVAANSTSDIDYKLPSERHINGGRLLVDNIGLDDSITFQVVDVDNILGYGANVVLDQFITDYYVPATGNLEVRLDYPARIYANLYLRLKYTSTHASGCSIKCNLYLHWKQV